MTTRAEHTALRLGHHLRKERTGFRSLTREQLLVAGGQLASGVGNLAFALIMARLLTPGDFADLASFLALYLLVHVPVNSLSAGSALSPQSAARMRRRVLRGGIAVGVAISATSFLSASLLHVPSAMIVALGIAVPGGACLALERGRLYGWGHHRRAVTSLLAEPATRLLLGVALGVGLGPLGAAAGVVIAGYAALAIARGGRWSADSNAGATSVEPDAFQLRPGAAVTAFLLLAVIQNQDLLLANRLLPQNEAAAFAALSTLGGTAAFATSTVPLVLMRRAAGRERRALSSALGVAGALGAAAVTIGAVAPQLVVESVFGERYASVAPLLAPYLLAMCLFGLGRVLVAHRCAIGSPKVALWSLVGAVILQSGLIIGSASAAGDVAVATLITTAALAVALTGAVVIPLRPPALRATSLPALLRRPPVPVVVALTALGLAIRLLMSRGIWLDEATSIYQAGLPFGEMIHNIRFTDVHPPLHHVLLWLTEQAFGTSEMVVRAPSIAAGVLLIPMLYVAGRDLYDRRAGVVAAALGAIAPLAVWYSQEARMYAFMLLLSLVAVWAQIMALREGRRLHWLAFALASAALLWTQYFSVLQLVVQQVAFAVAAWRRRKEGGSIGKFMATWWGCNLLILALVLPLLPILRDQLIAFQQRRAGVPSQVGADVSPAAREPSIYAILANVIWALWGYHSTGTMIDIVALWPLLMLLGLFLLGRGRSFETSLLVAVSLLPVAVLFGTAFVKADIFEVRYFAGAIPALLLLCARGVTGFGRSHVARLIAIGLLLATLCLGLADQQLNRSNPRIYDFEGALEEVRDRSRPGDKLVYEPPYLDHVIEYYAPDVSSQELGDGAPVVRSGERVFLLASFLDKPQFEAATDQAVAKLRRRERLVVRLERPQVVVWVFANDPRPDHRTDERGASVRAEP